MKHRDFNEQQQSATEALHGVNCSYSKNCHRPTEGFRMCAEHRAQAAAASKRWANKNGKDWRDKNRDKIKQWQRDTIKKHDPNGDKKRVRDAAAKKKRFFRNRAYMLGFVGRATVTAKELAAMWHAQRGRCAVSGRRLTRENAHVDHRISLTRGGGKSINNLRWTVSEANVLKLSLMDGELLTLCQDIVRTLAG